MTTFPGIHEKNHLLLTKTKEWLKHRNLSVFLKKKKSDENAKGSRQTVGKSLEQEPGNLASISGSATDWYAINTEESREAVSLRKYSMLYSPLLFHTCQQEGVYDGWSYSSHPGPSVILEMEYKTKTGRTQIVPLDFDVREERI